MGLAIGGQGANINTARAINGIKVHFHFNTKLQSLFIGNKSGRINA
jgi:transcription antitermination factor NusA-like protein